MPLPRWGRPALLVLIGSLASWQGRAGVCPGPQITEDGLAAGSSLDELVHRVETEGLRYVFIGERHDVGPVKRFAVDLANTLLERGHDVGLYVEGFRTDCAADDRTCRSLARWFNPDAFGALLEQARAPVHAIDPPGRDDRTREMIAAIARGTERIRIVLVGDSHVRHAWDPEAELWVFGGGVRFPDPGDVAEGFPERETVTISLETSASIPVPGDAAAGEGLPYTLWEDRCVTDYRLTTLESADYWGRMHVGDDPPPREPSPTASTAAAVQAPAEAAVQRH